MPPLVLDDFIYLFKFLLKKTLITKNKKTKWTMLIPSPMEKQNNSSARDLRNLRNCGIKKEREERRRGRRDPVDPQPHKHSWPIVVGLSPHQSVTHYTPKPPYKPPIRPKWHKTPQSFRSGQLIKYTTQKKGLFFFIWRWGLTRYHNNLYCKVGNK